MTPAELAQYGIQQPTNEINAALVWLLAIAATCAVVAYAAIRANDRLWKKRVKREGVR